MSSAGTRTSAPGRDAPRPGQRTSKPVPLAAHLPFTLKTIGTGVKQHAAQSVVTSVHLACSKSTLSDLQHRQLCVIPNP